MVAGRRTEVEALLRRRVLSGIYLGVLRAGNRLPSARELSAELRAHPRVILAAYRELERDGLVEVRPQSGIYVVAMDSPPGAMLPGLAAWVVNVFAQGLVRGVPAPQLPERMRRCLETLRLQALCVECNADQIESLCDELHEDYGLETAGVEVGKLGEATAELRRADLLVTTSFHANEVRRAAESLGKPWVAVVLRADVLDEVVRHLAVGPVYFIGTDPRFAVKLKEMFGAVAPADHVRSVILGLDDADGIPVDAPVYLMHRARRRLEGLPGGSALLERIPPLDRLFAPESAREILELIVRANLAAIAARPVGAPISPPRGPPPRSPPPRP